MTSHQHGRAAEDTFMGTIRARGAKIYLARQRENFDFWVNGRRVEFKTARPTQTKRQSPYWQFSLHRHGKLNESDIDFYVVCFEEIPYMQKNFYGAVQAPVQVKSLSYGMPDLLKHAESLHRLFEEIVNG